MVAATRETIEAFKQLFTTPLRNETDSEGDGYHF